MKLFLAQQNYRIGDFDNNIKKIIELIEAAKSAGGDLILFSELSVCGYPPRDFLEFRDFISKCNEAIEKIREYADTIAVVIGAPSLNKQTEGKDLHNSAYFLHEKEVKAVIHKTCLPTYDVFDEDRYFEPASEWNLIHFKGKKIAITICEDIWNLGDNPLYKTCPMDELMSQKPDLILNLSASPFDYTHVEDRKAIIRRNVEKYRIPLLYCNCVGSQTEIVFDGGSLVFDAKANLIKQLPLFKEALEFVEWKDDGSFTEPVHTYVYLLPEEELSPVSLQPSLCIAEIHDALVSGIRDYFRKMGFTKAILGSSGGIDSAVTLALACAALGKENVRAVLLPSPYSTSHSVSDAEQLSRNLGNPYDIVPIEEVYSSFLNTLKPILVISLLVWLKRIYKAEQEVIY